MDTLTKVIYILILIIITSLLGYYFKYREAYDNDFEIPEHFEDYSKLQIKSTINNIYDTFYTSIYDTLFHSDLKNEFEIYNITEYTIKDTKKNSFTKDQIKLLDIGCGTGGHLKIWNRDKYNVVGLDKSMNMLKKAQEKVPDVQLIQGDYMNKSTFNSREFSHITCLFYTLYYSENPGKLFQNVNFWLKPKGFFIIHLVNPKKFDPVLERSSKLVPLYNPQKNVDSRATTTKLKFNKFNYLADWKFTPKGQNIQFLENFFFKDNSKHRKNIHNLTMFSIKYYVKLAEKNGFKLVRIVDLFPTNHDNNYLYIFQKVYGD